VITNKNVNRVKAKLIVEAANIPVTLSAEEKLHKRGILIVPDFVANAGGVISSYVEYSGGKPKDVPPLIKKKILRNTKIVLNHSKKEKITTREAALEIAKKRIRAAIKKRGY